MKKYLPIGSYSSDTMQPKDIIPELLYQLRKVNKRKATKWETDYNRMLKNDQENDCEFLNDLTNAMEQYCPPYTYVGSHPEDRADIGCWIGLESLEDGIRHDGSILKIDVGEAWPKGLLVEYVLEVTDHGNIALFNYCTKKEIWSIV